MQGDDFFRLLVTQVPDYAIFGIDRDGRITSWNTGVRNVFGYDEDEFVGRDAAELFVPEDRTAGIPARELAQAASTGAASNDRWMLRRDGTVFWAAGRTSRVLGSDGALAGFTKIVRDRSDLKRGATPADIGSAERARALLEQSPLPMLVFDLAGRPVAANPAWERTWGVRLADAPPDYTLLSDPQLEAQGYAPLVRRALAGEVVTLPSVRYDVAVEMQGQGNAWWVQGHFYPIRNAAGELTEIVLVQVDITELHDAQLALRASEARFRAAVEAVSDILWTNDAAGRMSRDQPQWGAFTGQTPAEYEGLGWADAVHPEDAQATIDAWQENVRRRGVFVFEHRLRRADGVYRRFAVRAVPVTDDEGNLREWVGVHTDITDRLKIEHELRRAERLQVVGTLAGGVAHEVNNQVTAILGLGHFVLEGLGDEHPQTADVTAMLDSARRAADITHQLLAFSRRQVTQPQSLDLHAVLLDLQAVLRRLVGSDRTLILEPPSGARHALADRTQIEQVVINLVANARDAVPSDGTVTISVDGVELDEKFGERHGVRPAAGAYVRLTVADTGTGMDAETLERIFEPFFTTKEVGAGTGLGLSMVYGIVKQHGGFIWAYSEPGRGTAIKVYLPSADPPGAAPLRDADRVPRRAAAAATVLVVEDEPIVRAMVLRSLAAAGYTVLEAPNAAEAAALLASGAAVSLVVTDVVMAGGGGAEVGRVVARVRPGLPVLYISGYPGEDVHRRGLVPPGAPFLSKPFSAAELAAKVAEVLG